MDLAQRIYSVGLELIMTYHVDWTRSALEKREHLISKDLRLRAFFASTYEALRNGEIAVPRARDDYEVFVEFTNYRLVIDVSTDMIVKIKSIEIKDVL